MILRLTFAEWLASLIAGGGVVLGVAVAVALLTRRTGSRAANVTLGLFLLATAAAVLYELAANVRPPDAGWSVVWAPLLYVFALGPLLYAYVRAKLGHAERLAAWHWVLPVVQAVLTVGMALAPASVQAGYMERIYAPWYGVVEDVVFTVSFATYIALCYRMLARSTDGAGWKQRERVWLRRLVTGAALAFAVSLAFNLADPLLAAVAGVDLYTYESVVLAENVAYSALLYWVALNGFVQAAPQARAVLAERRREHYNLDPDLVAAHVAALDRLIETDRPHLDPDLSLPVLAAQLGVTDNVLSYVLNEGKGSTYAELVNGLRVDEARRRLGSPDFAHLSVLGVGYESGFRSKATFYRAFKRATGQTPSAFRSGIEAS